MVPQPKCRYSFLFSEFLIDGPVPVERVRLGHVTLVLTLWEAIHATGGGQWGAELRDDCYGGVPPVEGC